ncbi:MAG: hypothetical protein PHT48_06185 [Dechloromonas sp.]|nr:hypothetical protein [Dechloromonas sp.]
MKRPRRWLVLFCCLMQPALAAPLGRLFFTAEERRVIEQQQPARDSASLELNGRIRYPNGRLEYWLNGQPTSRPASHHLAVGDRLQPASHTRQPLLGDGKILYQPGGPQP